MIEQPKVVKALYVSRLQDLLARREAHSSPTKPACSGLCKYLSPCPETKAEEKAVLQLGLLLVHYRTKGDTKILAEDIDIRCRTMAGLLRDYHDCYIPPLRRAMLLAMAWAQVLADIRAIPATELTTLVRAYHSAHNSLLGIAPSLAEIFEAKPDAVALKRLSLPASGQSAFTKRIMEIVGDE